MEVMIWTMDGGFHATTYGELRDALRVEPVLLEHFSNYVPADGDGLFAVNFVATARAANASVGQLPVDPPGGVWNGEIAMAIKVPLPKRTLPLP